MKAGLSEEWGGMSFRLLVLSFHGHYGWICPYIGGMASEFFECLDFVSVKLIRGKAFDQFVPLKGTWWL